ncbi:hypothetical protein COP2_047342 [Malus domestica]
MSCFLLPKFFYDELNRLVARFWWNNSEESRKIHWLAWDKLCRLGFRNLHAFNLGLITKQAWKLQTEPNSLVAQVFRAKYFPSPHSPRLQSNPGIPSSGEASVRVEMCYRRGQDRELGSVEV